MSASAKESTGKKLAGAAPWTLVSRLVTLGATVGVSALAFRALQPEEYGLLAVVRNGALLVVLIASGGLDRTLWRFGPEILARGGERLFAALERRVFRWQLVITVIILGLVWLLGLDRALSFIASDDLSTLGGPQALGAFAALVVTTVAFQRLTAARTARFRTRAVAAATLGRGSVWLVAGAGLAALVAPVTGWIAAEAAAFGVGAVVLARPWRRRGSGPPLSLASELPANRHVKLALVFVISGLVNFVVQRQSEVFFIARYHGLELSGIYDLVYSYPQLALEFVPLAVSPVVSSAFAEVYSRAPEELGALTRRYFRALAMLALPIAALGIAWADVVAEVLFGARIADASHWANAMSAIHVLPLVFIPLSTALVTAEKAHLVLPLGPVQAALNLGLDVLLIPKYGIAGAAGAVLGTLAFGIPATFWLTRRLVGPVQFPTAFVVRSIVASAAVAVAWPLRLLELGPALALIGPLCSVGALVVSFRLLRILTADDIAAIRARLKR